MAKKTETKTEKVEREYIIPLRAKYQHVPRYRKTPKAIKTVKEFLARHMKVRDRDLNKIKLDKFVNEALWSRGIKNPLHKIKVKATKEGDIVRVELVDFSKKLKAKKAREDKISKAAEEVSKKKKAEIAAKAEAAEAAKKTEENVEKDVAPRGVPQSTESRGKEKEKKAAVVEAGEQMEKAAAKQAKQSTKTAGKMTKQKHQVRKALAK
jgi:large subunit ribosomal protein L31e